MGAGGEGDNRGWEGWMASPTRWTWVSLDSGSWWWTGRPGVLQSVHGGQGGLECCSPWGRKESDTTEQLNWTELISPHFCSAFHFWFLVQSHRYSASSCVISEEQKAKAVWSAFSVVCRGYGGEPSEIAKSSFHACSLYTLLGVPMGFVCPKNMSVDSRAFIFLYAGLCHV